MWLRRAAVITIAALVGVGALAGPASAHNTLKSSTPAANATLPTPPDSVTLTFEEKLDPATTTVTVTGPDGAPASDPSSIDGMSVVVKVRPGAPGKYTVTYKLVSDDGDPVTDSFTFTATAGNKPTAAPATTSPVKDPQASVAPPATQAAPTGSDKKDEGTPAWVWVLVGLAVLVVLGGGLALGRRRSGSA
ncbi:copper resistance protein [Longispora fulva]|uniref:Methionine-rich copper-binding protein CopC n=1 Tax=Longispora fulva TaxID=619741 RepID=A0A8J7GIW9_9ACTN|nr:copper resistance CopC family protein [Longispora fulva]MBG6137303.1 methionine-rich copper-binding protein CopC [Longispora fulva]GIG61342.1 copper resistance protein [Longispora fulva]